MIRLSQRLQAWIRRSQHLPGVVSRGISLIEALVVLSILAVLLAIAAPNLSDIIRNGRLNSQNSQMVYSLNLARSEAVKRMVPAVVCRGTTSGCAGAGAWETGWIVFADLNGDGNYAAGDELLEVTSGLRPGFTLRSTSSIQEGMVRFDAHGSSSVSSLDAKFILCQDGQEKWARFVIVTPAGRIRRGIDNTEINSCTPDPL